ncbi:MAG: DUF4215 domain-containing protein, partial [Candidatus Moranbacteria bacterium]|nr:DUF4215 domain-containing protein [Candidatus Moranbacteria bacterium]
PGASFTYACSDSNITSAYTNVAVATATGSNGTSNVNVSDSDSSKVTVKNSSTVSVQIDKNDNDNGDDTQEVVSGGNAAFRIRVTNTGQATLSNVKVVDAEAPACSEIFSNTLAPGASFTYTCSDANVTAAYTNVAVATATGSNGTSNVNVSDSDSSRVTIKDVPEDPYCGDGEINEGEQCDDGNSNDKDGCSNSCKKNEDEPKKPEGKCKGSIGNYIWNDTNMDGVQDSNEKGIENIRVKAVWDGGDGKFGNSNDETFRTNTNHNGHYEFTGLCEGEYKITVKEEDTTGLKQTYDPDGKLDGKTKVELDGNKDSTTKIDFGYVGKNIPVTGPGAIALYLALATAAGTMIVLKKKKNLVA